MYTEPVIKHENQNFLRVYSPVFYLISAKEYKIYRNDISFKHLAFSGRCIADTSTYHKTENTNKTLFQYVHMADATGIILLIHRLTSVCTRV